ncbi:MAG: alpha/beta hydrolase [Polyangiales bacterium]
MTAYVFVHGMPGNAYTWESFFEHAPSGVRCIGWDGPDCGDGPDVPGATLVDYENALMEEVKGAGSDVVLVGHSFGAWLVARVLPRLGGAVRRAVLISGLPSLTKEHADSFVGLADALASGAVAVEQAVGIAVDLWLPTENRDPIHVSWIERMMRHEGKDRLARGLRRIVPLADPAWAVGPYETPASLVHSEADRAAPLAYGQALAALGRDTKMTVLPGDSHMVQWTAPEALARIVFA